MIQIDEELIEKIRTHAVQAYPDECCGALMGKVDKGGRIVRGVLPLENRAGQVRRRYLITAEEYRLLDRLACNKEQEILGFYHSHPDQPSRPSDYDREHALPWYAYFIVSVVDELPGEVTCWKLSDDRSRFRTENYG
jgi:proteasome lid subunit RPN8/RPN11